MGLALSGGGYRAMVFHVGALIRLNEVGLLSKLKRVSSVPGGSITAGVLGMCWNRLAFQNGVATRIDIFIERVWQMADVTVDAGAIIGGFLLSRSISDGVADAYDRVLFKRARLSSLPDDTEPGNPRFVINATDMQSAALWRFSRNYMGDYRVGLVHNPDVSPAAAVTASSAFPPVLPPCVLKISQLVVKTPGADLNAPPYTDTAILSDGGVYDNLRLESIEKRYITLLVSDAGQKIAPHPDPHQVWARHSLRVLDVVDNQVRSLRKLRLMACYKRGEHNGAYWGMRTKFSDYELSADPHKCTGRNPKPLAEILTRLQAMPRDVQDRLMNWGYAICDAALRARLGPDLQAKLGVSILPPQSFAFTGGY